MKDKFAELFGIDVRSLAVLRMGLGILLLVDLAIRATDFSAHYTSAGVLPWNALANAYRNSWRWSLHAIGASDFAAASLFVCAAIAAACLLLGWHTRLATCVSWLLLASLHTRNPLIINAGDTLMRMLLFWSMFLPLGGVWSIDAARRGATRSNIQRIVSVATACILLQICLMYWLTAFFKMNDVWRTGMAMYYVVSFDAYARPLAAWLARFEGLLGWLSLVTVWGELLAPVLVFIPIGTTLLRIAVIAFFVFLHTGIELTMTVGLFSYVSILGWVLFLPTPCWNTICRAGRGGSSPAENPSAGLRWAWDGHRAVSCLAMAFFVLVLAWNAAKMGWSPAQTGLSAGGRRLGELAMLMQNWRMFARPAAHDGWIVVAARLKDGRSVDLRRGGAALSWQRPARMADLDPNHRWRKYYLNLVNERFRDYRPWFCRSMAGAWDQSHPPEEAVRRVDLYWVEEKTMPPGEPPRVTQVLLHHERIRSQGPFLDALEETLEQTEGRTPSFEMLETSVPLILGLACAAGSAHAQVDFQNSDITFSKPSIIGGNGTVRSNDPTLTKLPDGYEVSGLSCKFTAGDATVPIFTVEWSSERKFNLDRATDVRQTIFGNTVINGPRGIVNFIVDGTIDGSIRVTFTANVVPLETDNPVSWNESAVVRGLSAGMHTLDLHSRVIWRNNPRQGDMLTVSSLYGVGVLAEPEPGLPIPAFLVCAALFMRARSRRAGALGARLLTCSARDAR